MSSTPFDDSCSSDSLAKILVRGDVVVAAWKQRREERVVVEIGSDGVPRVVKAVTCNAAVAVKAAKLNTFTEHIRGYELAFET